MVIGQRVAAILGVTKTMREGSTGTVIRTDPPAPGERRPWVLVEWDQSSSGPIWHYDDEVKEIK